jgi:hypothetical protein
MAASAREDGAPGTEGDTTWEELLGGGDADSYLLVQLGQLLFVWPKESSSIKVLRNQLGDPAFALTKGGAKLRIALEVEVPSSLIHDADPFVAFCREFCGAGEQVPFEAFTEAIQDFTVEHGGILGLVYNASETRTGKWSGHLAWGQEAPDSPMAGAQALGIGESPVEVLRQIAEEAHIEVAAPSEHPAPEYGPVFALTKADVRLLTSDLSDYGGDSTRAMEGMLALDTRMRRWLKDEKSDPDATVLELVAIALFAEEEDIDHLDQAIDQFDAAENQQERYRRLARVAVEAMPGRMKS